MRRFRRLMENQGSGDEDLMELSDSYIEEVTQTGQGDDMSDITASEQEGGNSKQPKNPFIKILRTLYNDPKKPLQRS